MRKDFLSVLGLIALVVVIAGIATAYGGAFPPNVMGHTSDEIKLDIATVVETCTPNSGTTCTASCPAPGANEEYVVLSGVCQSLSSASWRQVGSRDSTSWSCQDMSHTVGQLLVATVYCLKGGTP